MSKTFPAVVVVKVYATLAGLAVVPVRVRVYPVFMASPEAVVVEESSPFLYVRPITKSVKVEVAV